MADMSNGPNILHVVIDMQRLFAEATDWHTPSLTRIVPHVVSLCEHFQGHTLFAKFLLPQHAEAAPGQWQHYYRRWQGMTLNAMDPSMQDLIAPLLPFATAENQVGKYTYSVFGAPGFEDMLAREGIDTLVFSGVETDVCVYASVLDAVDRGLHVILPQDALGSSDEAAHDAILTHVAPRLAEQILITTVDAIRAVPEIA